MEISTLIVSGVGGALMALAAVPLIRRIAARRTDQTEPREFHQTHRKAIPRYGGLCFAAAFLIVAAICPVLFGHSLWQNSLFLATVLSSLAMFGVGFFDDLKPLGAKKKLLLQIAVALGAYYAGVQISVAKNPFNGVEYNLGGWGALITVVWLVALTNLINLIDGIDGLAGGIALMLMGLLVYSTLGTPTFAIVLASGVAGSLLVFLRYNFPPAKIYMGDGGAYFLGFLIGVLSIVNSQKGTITAGLVAPFFALGLPILDVALAILRRGLKGLPIFRPDRKHIHHMLVAAGLSRRRTVVILYAISLVFMLIGLGAFWSQARWIPVFAGIACAAMLVVVRTTGFVGDWLSLGKVVGNSLQMRKETRYAMALGQWFQLEAERCDSFEKLWENYSFVVQKLGFKHVKLRWNGREQSWCSQAPSALLQYREHRFVKNHTIEFAACESINPLLFEHVSELAAENWHRACSLWHQNTGVFLSDTRHVVLDKNSNIPLRQPHTSLVEVQGFISADKNAMVENQSEHLTPRTIDKPAISAKENLGSDLVNT